MVLIFKASDEMHTSRALASHLSESHIMNGISTVSKRIETVVGHNEKKYLLTGLLVSYWRIQIIFFKGSTKKVFFWQ